MKEKKSSERFKYVENQVFRNQIEMQEMEFNHNDDKKEEGFQRINTWNTGITPRDLNVALSEKQMEEDSPRFFTSQETDRNLENLNTDRKLLPNRQNANLSDQNISIDNKFSIDLSL